MLDDKTRAELDQSISMMKEGLPKVWKGLFDGCIQEGFTIPQAMELVKTFIKKPYENNE